VGKRRSPFNPASGNGQILLITNKKLLKRQGKNPTFDKSDFSYLHIDFSYAKIEAACSSETSKQTLYNICVRPQMELNVLRALSFTK
jgi:hypothetical protein